MSLNAANAGAAPPGTAGLRGNPLLPVTLFLLAVGVFANSFPGAYIADDVAIVRDNPLVVQPHLRSILAADYWGLGVNSGLHRPLTILSYALNRMLFGPDPFSFHLVNVLLHGGVTLLFYGAMLALGLAPSTAWPVAAVFAVHPMHTEAVNIITGRAELLAAAFIFLGLLLAYRRGRFHLPAVGLCHAAALLSKESAAVFPALLVLGDLFADRDWRRVLRLRRLLYVQSATLTLAWLAARRWALPFAGLPMNRPYGMDNPLVDLPWIPGLLTALKVQLVYLAKLILPVRLHAIYIHRMFGPVESLGGVWSLLVPLAFLLLAALTVIGWRRRAECSLGVLWYAAAFSVTANILYVTPFLVAERFAYTPSAGFGLAAASLAALASGRLRDPRMRKLAALLFAAWLAALAGRTLARNSDFRSNSHLWETEVRNRPDNTRAWILLAGAYELEGRPADAERSLLTALDLDPGFTESNLALGFLWVDMNRPDEARQVFERIVKGGGTSYLALLGLARADLMLGRPLDALAALGGLPAFFEQRAGYWELAGKAMEDAGNYTEAVEAYRRALALPDHSPEAWDSLSTLLIRLGNPPEGAVTAP